MLPAKDQQHLLRLDWLVFLVLICAAALSFIAADTRAESDNFLHVYFLDVGQGDAIFLQMGKNQILIDGGPDSKIMQELADVMPFGDRSIDVLVLTHPDADHMNGLIEVLERYDVGVIIENFLEKHQTPAYDKWNELKTEAKVIQSAAGQTVNIGPGARLLIIYPLDQTQEQSKVNNNSIIAKLIYGENELLLTGDIEAKIERELVLRGIDLDADLLKAPHHGSKTSTTEELLGAVAPEAVFIQVGSDNRYGHPHPTVVQRLEDRGIKIYRTDIDGRIELILNQVNYQSIP